MSTLADYEDKVEDIPAGGGNRGSDLKDLPDGEYEFSIHKSALKTIEKTGSELFEMELEVLGGPTAGRKYQRAYWLTSKDGGGINEVSIGILKKDLATLGFDVAEWKKANGRSFVTELKKAAKIMPSMQFKAKKATKSKYAQLYINARLDGDGKPEKFDAKAMNELTAQPFSVEGDEY